MSTKSKARKIAGWDRKAVKVDAVTWDIYTMTDDYLGRICALPGSTVATYAPAAYSSDIFYSLGEAAMSL